MQASQGDLTGSHEFANAVEFDGKTPIIPTVPL
jgi:hypothetical protein